MSLFSRLFSNIRQSALIQDTQQMYIPNPDWYNVELINIENSTQARALAPVLLNQAQDSADLLNSTISPQVFFKRYDFLLNRLDLLVKCSRWVKFSGAPPQVNAHELRTLEKRTAVINDFLERYQKHVCDKLASLKTLKGKKNNLEKLQAELFSFQEQLSPEQLNSLKVFFDERLKELEAAEIFESNRKKQLTPSHTISSSVSEWEISLAFGNSRSPIFQQALYFWEKAPRHIFSDGPIPTYQCFFSSNPNEFLTYLQLYDIIKGWKTTVVMVNGKFVDKHTVSKINRCYGDKCRCRKKDFCFGASEYSNNPFGCHRLQIEATRHPWYSFGRQQGNLFIIDKQLLKDTILENSVEYQICPSFDLQSILERLDNLPNVLTLKQLEKMDPCFYYSHFNL